MTTKTMDVKKSIKKKGINNFTNEIKAEIKKIEWPTKRSVLNSSVIIIIIMIFYVTFVTIADIGLSNMLVRLRNL